MKHIHIGCLVLSLTLKHSFNEVELSFVLCSMGFIKNTDSHDPSLKDLIILHLAMLDLLFQFIIKVSFEMVVEGGVVENSWGITEEAV